VRRTAARAGTQARAIGLLPLAGYGVHQLRYALVPGTEDADAHGYLVLAPLLLALLGAVLAGRYLSGCARGGDGGPRARSIGRTIAVAGLALLAIYVVQELIEAACTPGAPLPFAAGGWIAVPLALALGTLVGLVLHVSDAGRVVLGSRVRLRRSLPRAAALAAPPTPLRRVVAHDRLARRGAGRAPPVVV
jgi:hypothetical protein